MEANDPGRAISIKYGKPLPRRPSYIRESDYWLIEALCKPTATKRASVANVLRSLYWLVTEEAIILRPLTSVKETVAGVDAVNCAPFETHMAGVLRQCLQLVGKSNTPAALSRRELNMHLYTRCWALHGLLVRHGTLPKKPVEKLGRRIVEFFTVLQSSAEPNTGDIYDFVAYHAQMQVYVDLHRGLDDCLADFGPVIQRPGEPEPPTVYQWQSRWSQLHQKQRELLLGEMKKASQALESKLRNLRGVLGNGCSISCTWSRWFNPNTLTPAGVGKECLGFDGWGFVGTRRRRNTSFSLCDLCQGSARAHRSSRNRIDCSTIK